MSLTDLMSAADLDWYAQVALVAFMVAFGLIVWRIFSPRNRSAYDRARMLPLDEPGEERPTSTHRSPTTDH